MPKIYLLDSEASKLCSQMVQIGVCEDVGAPVCVFCGDLFAFGIILTLLTAALNLFKGPAA